MTQRGLVSCIVPTYNRERYLREALDSIVAQTYRPIEIIVADDGSTDGTQALVEAYTAAPIIYVWQANAGTAAARNLGIGASTGEYIAFLDSDDRWHPEKLARQVSVLEARPELGYCLSHVKMFWEDGEIDKAEAAFLSEERRAQVVPGYSMPNVMARRSVFDRVGLLDVSRRSTEGVEWLERATEAGVLSEMLPDVLLQRRWHQNNMTRGFNREFRDEWLQHVKRRLDRKRAEPA